MARLHCHDWSRSWSLNLERRWSLRLLLVLDLHWRLQRLTLALTQAVRVEDAMELGLHLLEELLPKSVEVGCGLSASTTPTPATRATSASTSTTSPGIAIRDNLSERQLMERKNPVLGAKKRKCQAHNARHGDQLPEPGIGD